jgi:hypothetical protein
MRENAIAIGLLAAAVLSWLWVATANANTNNNVMKYCVQNTPDYTKAASCYFSWKQGKEAEELAELRDFLKHNPRYRYPGQSNNKCWGKPREMPFESAYIKQTQGGFEAGVSYKDKLPAGCYETAPWDNRDALQ